MFRVQSRWVALATWLAFCVVFATWTHQLNGEDVRMQRGLSILVVLQAAWLPPQTAHPYPHQMRSLPGQAWQGPSGVEKAFGRNGGARGTGRASGSTSGCSASRRGCASSWDYGASHGAGLRIAVRCASRPCAMPSDGLQRPRLGEPGSRRLCRRFLSCGGFVCLRLA